LKIVAFFSSKIHLFVEGRKNVFSKIKKSLDLENPVLWIHAASLGEFEQGRPVIERLKEKFPKHQIVVTFFSPSGYEVRKDYELADVVCYLPLDRISNAKNFIKTIQPSLVVFVKYDFWPNYINELYKQQIPMYLISGIFRENQVFFKRYGGWMRKHLSMIEHFFVQDDSSEKLLKSIGINNVTIAGDTRFDRVQKELELNAKLSFVSDFKQNSYLLVAGSTWPEDEKQLADYINTKASEKEKFIIAPHNINKEGVLRLKERITKKAVLYSDMEGKNISSYDVFIVDTVGILSKIYAYADVAYIGGGYTKSGVHNTLEAATFGLPIVIGPNFKKFKEVKDLIRLKGCVSVKNSEELTNILAATYKNPIDRNEKSRITRSYVAGNLGATDKIMNLLTSVLADEE